MINKIFKLFLTLIILFNLVVMKMFCVMPPSGDNYKLTSNVLETAGGEIESPNHTLNDSIGQTAYQVSAGEKFTASLGFFYTVPTDILPPRTDISAGAPNYVTTTSTYVTLQTQFNLSAIDDLVTVGDGIGMGVKETQFSVQGSEFGVYTGTFGVVDSSSISGIPQGCISMWKFDEGSGTTANDTVGTNNGTLVGTGATWTSNGKESNAINFNGTAEYVNIAHSPSLNISQSQSKTIEFWANINVTQDNMIVYKQAGWVSGSGYSIIIDAVPRAQAILQDNNTYINLRDYTTGTNIVPGTWNHIALVVDRGSNNAATLYVNGEVELTAGLTGFGGMENTLPLRIGGPLWGGAKGKIDEVAIYSRALTQEEITQRYAGVVPLTEGPYEISYKSTDILDNMESAKTATVILDETPPVTEFTLNGSYVNVDPPEGAIDIGTYDINESTGIYSVDGSSPIYVPPGYELVFSTNPGHIYLVPVGTGGAAKPAGKWVNFINLATELILTAADTYSGVNKTEFRVAGSEFENYTEPISLSGDDGLYKIEYRSEDNLNHIEVTRSTEVYLDNTAPASQLEVGSGKWEVDGNVYVSTLTEFTLTADDGHGCGVKEIKYSIDGQVFTTYHLPLTTYGLSEGEHTISYYSTDLLDKEEPVKMQKVILDKTPPETILTAGEPKYESGEKMYVTMQTSFTLTATDPLLESGQTPSGVKTTSWRIDDNDWIIYEDSFTLLSLPSTPGIPQGCISMWKFDEGGGTTAFDTVDGNHGTIYGASPVNDGKEGKALSFDGINDYVKLNRTVPVNAFTFMCWVDYQRLAGAESGAAAYGSLVSAINGHPSRNRIMINKTSKQVYGHFYVNGNSVGVMSDSNLSWEGWHHVAVSFDNINFKIYYDGALVKTISAPGNLDGGSDILHIGALEDDPGWYLFKGKMDEAVLYSRALTEEEIMQQYAGAPVTEIAEGEHTLLYYSIDNVNNKETVKSETLILDKTPPEVTISSPTGGEQFIANISSITINYSVSDNLDPAPKVNAYLTDLEEGTTVAVSNGGVIDPLSIDDGFWKLTVEAEDCLGHKTSTETASFEVIWDILPPRTAAEVGSGKWESEGKIYITSHTEISLTAVDDLINIEDGIGLGVEEIKYSIDGSLFSTYHLPLTTYGLSEGEHTISYYSVDVIGNTEQLQTLNVAVDNAAPATEISVSLPRYTSDEKLWVSSETTVSLSATDGGQVPCGVKYTEYKIDDGFYSIYNSFATGEPTWPLPTSGLSEGEHTIYYRSYDNLLNCEAEKSLKVIIDNSEPETYVLASEPKYNEYITSESTFSFVAVDSGTIPSGVKGTQFRVQGSEFSEYVSTFNITGNDGIYTVKYYSTDNVDNTEAVRDLTIKLDNAKPATQLIVQGSKFIDNGKMYITPQTEIILSAEDPLINNVASGVKTVTWKLGDSETWEIYTDPFNLSEGARAIKYYAVDQLNNTELTNSITLYADGTAPVTSINIGEPKYEAFGNTVISPNTPLTLISVDPVVTGVASQVKRTEYRVNGGDFVTYTGTFTLTEGIHTLEYRSIDNVENTEELKSITLTVTYISEYAAFGAEGVHINGNGAVYGDVRSNSDVNLNGNALVDGDVSGNTVEINGNKVEITGEIIKTSSVINPGVIDIEAIVTQVSQNNDNANIPSLKDGVLKLTGNSLTLPSGTYYLAGIELAGKSKLYFEGKVNIVCTGKILVAGQSEVHHSGEPYDLVIYCSTSEAATPQGSGGCAISISGQGEFQSVIYAPYSDVSVSGNGITLSNVFAKQLSVSGNGKLVGVGYSSGTVVAAGPKMLAAPQADPAFVLGEVYSYPNPAKRGACPTLHIECGIADSVEINIYNIAAELVHSAEVNNSQLTTYDSRYCYEYTWDISDIASGVYIYVIRANKNGFGTIKATGKCAVIK